MCTHESHLLVRHNQREIEGARTTVRPVSFLKSSELNMIIQTKKIGKLEKSPEVSKFRPEKNVLFGTLSSGINCKSVMGSENRTVNDPKIKWN